ncbi:MAG: M14 family metallopeptidase [Erythrobacter sp.]
MMTFRLLIIAVLLALAPVAAWAEPAPFVVAGETITPGSRADFRIIVPEGSDRATFIPVTVIHGTKPGPVLAMVAGVHGFEFASILAAERLAERVDPARLSGTLVLVRIANIPGFEGRSPNVNPVDRKNLNRVFPGKADGTQTERMADLIAHEVVARSDFLMDVHSGDGAEFLDAFVGVYGGPLSTDFPLALKVARGFGFPNVVRYSMDTQEQIDRGRSLNRQGVAMGKPTILVEIGQNGSREEVHVSAIVTGVENTLQVLGMAEGTMQDVPPPVRLFEGTIAVAALHTGVFHPASLGPRSLARGEFIGTIRDYTGKDVEKVYSPVDGYALYGITGPPVEAGDGIVTIAIPTHGF